MPNKMFETPQPKRPPTDDVQVRPSFPKDNEGTETVRRVPSVRNLPNRDE